MSETRGYLRQDGVIIGRVVEWFVVEVSGEILTANMRVCFEPHAKLLEQHLPYRITFMNNDSAVIDGVFEFIDLRMSLNLSESEDVWIQGDFRSLAGHVVVYRAQGK